MKKFIKLFVKTFILVVLLYYILSLSAFYLKAFQLYHFISNFLPPNLITSLIFTVIIFIIKKENINKSYKALFISLFIGIVVVFFYPRYSWGTAWGSSVEGRCIGIVKTVDTSSDSWNHTCFGFFTGSKKVSGGL